MKNLKTTRLSEKEIEVLILTAQGNSASEISEILGNTASSSVSNCQARIRKKLEARNTVHAVVIAIRQGLI